MVAGHWLRIRCEVLLLSRCGCHGRRRTRNLLAAAAELAGAGDSEPVAAPDTHGPDSELAAAAGLELAAAGDSVLTQSAKSAS